MQIGMGGLVSSNYAGLSCTGFPTCNGEWFPAWNYHTGLQMLHRSMGYVVFVLSLLMRYRVGQSNAGIPALTQRIVRAMPGLVLFQISLGIVNVLYQIPISMSVLHLANAALMLVLSLCAALELFAARRPSINHLFTDLESCAE